MKGINVIFMWVGLPFLFVGLIVGSLFTYNYNLKAPTYSVSEICKGPDCKFYEEDLKANMDLCYELSSRSTYIQGSCFWSSDEFYKCVSNNTVISCYDKIKDTHAESLRGAIIRLKGEYEKRDIEIHNLNNDLDQSRTKNKELNELLKQTMPDTIYCNPAKDINFTFNYSDMTTKMVMVKDYARAYNYPHDACGVCGITTEEPYIVCYDYGSFAPKEDCVPCSSNGYNRIDGCVRGNFEIRLPPRNYTILIKGNNETGYKINETWPVETRIDLFKQLKELGCSLWPKEVKHESNTASIYIS